MLRLFTLHIMLAFACGCANHPVRVVVQGDVTAHTPPDNTASHLMQWTVAGQEGAVGKVAIIDVDGLLVNRNLRGLGSLGENPVALFREKLDAVAADPQIHAVVLRINSPGGGVTATDIMRRDLIAFKNCRDIPIVACLMDVGAGGAYYVATAADSMIAHPTSLTGGVGVILNIYNLEDALGQFNVIPIPIRAGEKIDLASPVRTMEQEERELLEGIAREFHDRFKRDLAASRPQLRATDLDLDGRVYTASQAFEKRLIDGIGYLDDALAAARQAACLSPSCPVVMFRRCNDRALTQYDVTPNIPLQNSLLPINIPGLDRSALPTFLYLWQPDPSLVTTAGAR